MQNHECDEFCCTANECSIRQVSKVAKSLDHPNCYMCVCISVCVCASPWALLIQPTHTHSANTDHLLPLN